MGWVAKAWIWQCICSYLWKVSTESSSMIMFSQIDRDNQMKCLALG